MPPTVAFPRYFAGIPTRVKVFGTEIVDACQTCVDRNKEKVSGR